MSKQYKTVSLSDDQRIALEALCRRRKVDALVWKRARAFLLLDAGEDAGTVCRILDIGPTVLTEWRFAFAGAGLSFFGLKDYRAPLLIQNRQIGLQLNQPLTGRSLTIYGINRGALQPASGPLVRRARAGAKSPFHRTSGPERR